MRLSYLSFLSWHAAHIRSTGHVDTAAAVLRSRSTALHDVIAYIATDDRYTLEELRKASAEGILEKIQFRWIWLATLGRVIALQAVDDIRGDSREQNLQLGLAFLEIANQRLPRDSQHQQFHRLQIELLIELRKLEEARRLIVDNDFLREYYYGYLGSDLYNPSISRTVKTYNDWIVGFNRPFLENKLVPIKASPIFNNSFNDLETDKVVEHDKGPKISVLMTSYKPDPDTFHLAVNSILKQSWRNLELIIIDDASPAKFNKTLNDAEKLDSRVRLIKLQQNGGTYRARNVGINHATGDYITGQDSDDWSHPERLAAQIQYLLSNPTTPGVVVEAIKANDQLLRTFPGRIPYGKCEVSLMLATELARDIGGYLDARKGADGEFRRRVEQIYGRKIDTIPKPLYLIRIGHDSLSKADFQPGWSHPVRRVFWSSTRYWHENTPPTELRLKDEDLDPVPIPNRFKINTAEKPPQYDVVFISDWRAYSSTQRTMIDQIRVLRAQGKRIGVLHLESFLSPSKETTRFCFEIERLVYERDVSVVIPDEHASTTLAIIHDPTILQFTSPVGVNLTSKLLIVEPNLPPPADASSAVMYFPDLCTRNAEALFRSAVIWTTPDPVIRRLLASYKPRIEVEATESPIVFQMHNWLNTRSTFCRLRPIIGRHAFNFEESWRDVSQTAPGHPDIYREFRVLGDGRAYLRKNNQTRYPNDWVVFREGEIQPEAFMSGLDFFVYFPDESYPQSLCREALEAAAAGAVVILPKVFEQAHGDTAIYASEYQVSEIVLSLLEDEDAYHAKVRENQNILQKWSLPDEYVEFINTLETTNKTGDHTISGLNA